MKTSLCNVFYFQILLIAELQYTFATLLHNAYSEVGIVSEAKYRREPTSRPDWRLARNAAFDPHCLRRRRRLARRHADASLGSPFPFFPPLHTPHPFPSSPLHPPQAPIPRVPHTPLFMRGLIITTAGAALRRAAAVAAGGRGVAVAARPPGVAPPPPPRAVAAAATSVAAARFGGRAGLASDATAAAADPAASAGNGAPAGTPTGGAPAGTPTGGADADTPAATPAAGTPPSPSANGAAAAAAPPPGAAATTPGAPAANGDAAALAAQLATTRTALATASDRLLRALADTENARRIAARDVADARAYALVPFARGLLPVADTLGLALAAAEDAAAKKKAAAAAATTTDGKADAPHDDGADGGDSRDGGDGGGGGDTALASLVEGVRATEAELVKVFGQHGLERYGAVGDTFDPNLHAAVFEADVPGGEVPPGGVLAVQKVGWRLGDRVLRAAEVGVQRKRA